MVNDISAKTTWVDLGGLIYGWGGGGGLGLVTFYLITITHQISLSLGRINVLMVVCQIENWCFSIINSHLAQSDLRQMLHNQPIKQ